MTLRSPSELSFSMKQKCLLLGNTQDLFGTETVNAAEAARMQFQPDRYALPGQIGDTAYVATVDARRCPVATRA